MEKARKTAIKIMLMQRGLTQAALARRLTCSRATVSLVIAGRRRSARVENAIAQHLGMPRRDLWPA
jgi:transcriptional regulator with XRE-family HTH domain